MDCVCDFIIDERRGDEICLRCGSIRPFYYPLPPAETEIVTSDFIKTVCTNNHIVKCIEDEALYKFSKKSDRSNAYAAYCIYFACNKHNAPRTLNEISKICFVSQSNILKYETKTQKVIKPSDLTTRVCYRLGIDSFIFHNQVSKISDELFNNLLINSPPQSVLAVGVYVLSMICGLKTLQNEIARACHVSTSCIRRLYRIYKEEILTMVTLFLNQPEVE